MNDEKGFKRVLKRVPVKGPLKGGPFKGRSKGSLKGSLKGPFERGSFKGLVFSLDHTQLSWGMLAGSTWQASVWFRKIL